MRETLHDLDVFFFFDNLPYCVENKNRQHAQVSLSNGCACVTLSVSSVEAYEITEKQ
jgi:hypothetical protein